MSKYMDSIKTSLATVPITFIEQEFVDEKIYAFVERMNQVISLITHAVLDTLNLSRDNDLVINLLQTMLDMGKHPSAVIANFSVPLWKRVVAIEQFRNVSNLLSILINIF